MKIGVADFGMNAWDGACFDTEERLRSLKEIGYDGIERVYALSPADAIAKAGRYRRAGMDFATCLGPTPEASIQWTSALGKPYLWVSGLSPDFEVLCRQANAQVAAAARWGVRVGLHNHMGTPVETQEQLDRFMAACPDCGLILDTAHLAAAGGDPAGSVRRYGDRLVSMHFKDWMVLNPEIGLDRWKERGRFCELGAGNIGLDHHAVLAALAEVGYDGWLFIEQDTHLQDPLVDLAHSREFLRQAGL